MQDDIPKAPSMGQSVRAKAPPLVQWPLPADVPKELQFEYGVRKFAVTRFFESGDSERLVNEALVARGWKPFPNGSLFRLAMRCVQPLPGSGQINGFFACIPGWRPMQPLGLRGKPKKKRNRAHSLSCLFDKYPLLEAAMCRFVIDRTVDKTRMMKAAVIAPEVLYDTFLAECKTHGVDSAGDWPFIDGLAKAGRVAIDRWYQKQRFQHPSAAALNELGEDMAKLVRHDYAASRAVPVAAEHRFAYSRIEQDEHKLDVMWTALQPGERPGTLVATHQTRVWAMAMFDSETQAILSSSVAYNVNDVYTHRDVLRLVHRAYEPPPRPRFLRIQDPEWRYAEGACYPAELEEFERNSWSALHMDHHASHITDDFQTPVKAVTRGQLTFALAGVPQGRPYIEGYFAKVASWSKWFASSVGNRPDSAERRNPETAAVENLIYLPFAEEHLDVRCRNYNVTPSAALLGQTPIERLFDCLRNGQIIRSPLGEFGSGNLHLLLPKVRANIKRRHNQPHGPLVVYFGYGCYMGPEFSACQELMFSQNLTPQVDLYIQEDARFAFAVPVDFPELMFKVVVQGRWRLQPHPLSWRTMMGAYANRLKANTRKNMPLLGPGVARGFARAAATSEGMANLLANYNVFMDRFGAGVVPNIALTQQDVDELLEYAEKGAASFESAVQEEAEALTEQLSQTGLTAQVEMPHYDPFGTLKDLK